MKPAANDQLIHLALAQPSTQRPIVVQPHPQARVTAPAAAPQPKQLTLLDEPTRLPAILDKAGRTSDVTDAQAARLHRSKAVSSSDERREPDFGNPATELDDDMIDNITSWYGRGKGSKKRR